MEIYGEKTEFLDYGHTITNIKDFKYLGRSLSTTNKYWTTLVENISKYQNKQTRVLRILVWEGVDTKVLGMFYKVVVQ